MTDTMHNRDHIVSDCVFCALSTPKIARFVYKYDKLEFILQMLFGIIMYVMPVFLQKQDQTIKCL